MSRWAARCLAIGAGVLLLAAGAGVAQDPMPLWQLEPFDRIELVNDQFHDLEAVRIPAGTQLPDKPDEYVGRPGLPPHKELHAESLYRIRRQENGQEYDVYGRSIRRILLYEDLLLGEARRLVRAGKFDEAFPYLRTVQDRSANWPGLLELQIEYHWSEGEKLDADAELERAFWSFRQAYELIQKLPPTPPGQSTELAIRGMTREAAPARLQKLADRWIDRLLVRGGYAEGRKVVARIESVLGPAAGARWRSEYARRADERLALAQQHRKANEYGPALEALEGAIAILPDSPRVQEEARQFYRDHGVLRVAVEHWGRFRHGPAGWTAADHRTSGLLHLPVARLTSAQESEDEVFESHFITKMERSNINRRVLLTAPPGRQWPDGKPVTVSDLARLLDQYTWAGSEFYHPALERLLVNLEPQLPDRLLIDFARPQFQPAMWLQVPFLRVRADPSGLGIETTGLGPYRPTGGGSDRAVFLANERYLESGKPRIRRVEEVRIASFAERLRALVQKRVDFIEHVPPRHLDRVRGMEGLRLLRQAEPRIHLLQFGLDRPEMRDRTLRRAIAYSIDRAAIFQKIQLKMDEENRIVSGLVPYGTLGYDTTIEPWPYDPGLARALVLGLRKQKGAVARLTLGFSGTETTRAACQEIARFVSAAGIEVGLIDFDEQPAVHPLQVDLRYQTVLVTNPIYDPVTVLTRDNPSLAQHSSPWLRRKRVELLTVPNRAVARELLPELHRMLHEDVAVLPLWQWVDHFVASENVAGIPDRPVATYDRVADWSIEPCFPDSHW